ncbi:MAG: tetratricopeptide repeat protein [Bacteroidota bacterium]
MNQHNFRNEQKTIALISEYEAMSQQGTVGFYEETVFFEIIKHYESTENFDRALEVTNHAIRQHRFCPDFYLKKAQILLAQSRSGDALLCLDLAEVYAPAELEVQLLRVEALSAEGRSAAAFIILDVLKQQSNEEDLTYIYFCEALVYEDLEDFDRMFYALRRSALANPKNRQAVERIWLSVEMSQKYEESVQLHEQLIDSDPYSYIAWYNLGHAYFCLQRYREAADAFEYAYIINDTFEFAYRDCGEACIKAGDFKRALKCYTEALEHIKVDTDLLTRMGYCQEQEQEFLLAKSYYLEALDLDHYNDLAYFRLGECYFREGNWMTAIGYYRKAITIDKRKEEYLAALATAYHQTDQNDLALLFFRKSVDTAPEVAQYWVLYATFLLDMGKNQEALEVLEEALQHAGGPELLYGKIACMILLERKGEAFYLLHKALHVNFDRYESMFELVPSLEGDPEIMTMIAAYQTS